jgi:hemin uptake protein HemP
VNESTEKTPSQDAVAAAAKQAAGAIPSIDSATLLQNHRELLIRHGNELYRLRLTKSGKLILHK